MSDTPRTDAEAFFPHESMYQVCDADFTRQLERELNAANGNVERLTKANLQLREGCEEQKQRIKRLEEALREIANQDYRGSRSTESQIAFMALEAKP